MDELLQEFVDSRGVDVRVDREQGVLRGVKLLGLESRNGRRYAPAALDTARNLYEGARVNVNHAKGHPLAARDYQDRLGLIRNVTLASGAGLFGDFYFNPKHTLAEQLLWDAQHAPENVGFSHNVQARTVRQGNDTLVEAILKVHSVDLVADPATTSGLFEQFETNQTVEGLRQTRPDLVRQIEEQAVAELATLRARLDELTAQAALRDRRQLAHRLLVEFHLPDPALATGPARHIVSEAFMNAVMAAPNESAMRAVVADRARLVEAAIAGPLPGAAGRPVAREQNFGSAGEPAGSSLDRFVRAIRG